MRKLVRLRPAAVEIIQGCVYHKYFELLNSNNINGHYRRCMMQPCREALAKMFLLLLARLFCLLNIWIKFHSLSPIMIFVLYDRLLFYSLSILTNGRIITSI